MYIKLWCLIFQLKEGIRSQKCLKVLQYTYMLRINTDCNPLEENHNNQVAKDTKQKQDLHTHKKNNHSCVVFIKKRVRISWFITFTSFVSKHTTTLAQLNLYKVFTLGLLVEWYEFMAPRQWQNPVSIIHGHEFHIFTSEIHNW